VPELEDVLRRLGLQPWDLVRLNEPVTGELGLASWPRDLASRAQWVQALATHPVLLQRPIITVDDATAVVARSPEAVLAAIPTEDH
jgi:arsenate reductase